MTPWTAIGACRDGRTSTATTVRWPTRSGRPSTTHLARVQRAQELHRDVGGEGVVAGSVMRHRGQPAGDLDERHQHRAHDHATRTQRGRRDPERKHPPVIGEFLDRRRGGERTPAVLVAPAVPCFQLLLGTHINATIRLLAQLRSSSRRPNAALAEG
jgi:hypothetical protein